MNCREIVGHLIRWRMRRGSLAEIRNLFEARPSIFCLKNSCKTLFDLTATRNNEDVNQILITRYGRHIQSASIDQKKRLASQCIIYNNTNFLRYLLESVPKKKIRYFYKQFILAVNEGRTECANMILNCFRERTRDCHNVRYKLSHYSTKFLFYVIIGHCKIKYYSQVNLELVVSLSMKNELLIYKTLEMIPHHPFATSLLNTLRNTRFFDKEYDTRIRLQFVEKALIFYLLKDTYYEDIIKYIITMLLS